MVRALSKIAQMLLDGPRERDGDEQVLWPAFLTYAAMILQPRVALVMGRDADRAAEALQAGGVGEIVREEAGVCRAELVWAGKHVGESVTEDDLSLWGAASPVVIGGICCPGVRESLWEAGYRVTEYPWLHAGARNRVLGREMWQAVGVGVAVRV